MSCVPERPNTRSIVALIVLATLARALVAYALPLGNDEVYYWEFARHPDWSDYAHPPMVGWIIQLFTLNLWLGGEFFVRLGALVFAAVNTWLLYRTGVLVAGARAGFYAALLYTASLYTTIIGGVFILPDAPQLLFWVLAMYLLLRILPPPHPASGGTPTPADAPREERPCSAWWMLLVGVLIGLAMLSKYHGVFLWAGVAIYILRYNRRWLKTPQLYLAGLISLALFTPVLVWNYQHDFISFSFQSGRVTATGGLRLDHLAVELLGQIAYQNPFCFVIMAAAVLAAVRGRLDIAPGHQRILLLLSLPLIGVFTSFALFRGTLPHWTGPGYVGLMVLGGVYAAERWPARTPKRLKAALLLTLLVTVAGYLLILHLPGHLGEKHDPRRLGYRDITLDFQGWDQIRAGFARLAADDVAAGRMPPEAPLFSWRWFPAAHLDYYVAAPLGCKLLVHGEVREAQRFAWINAWRGHLKLGEDAYYIDLSNLPMDAETRFGKHFERVELAETVPVYRGGKQARNAFIYRLINCTKPMEAEGR